MTVPLLLNHLYRVVDAETFSAARDSAWLREVFAPSERRTTRRTDWEYTGLYWYGTTTYVELFEEGAQGPVGASGIALAVETPGATPDVAEAWQASLGDAQHRLVVRPGDEVSVPWFHIAHAVPDHRAHLKLWSMEYAADFLSAWHADRTPGRGISRREVLERYAAVAGGPAAPLLDDVTAVSLALSPAERGFLDRSAQAFDVDVRDVGGDVHYLEGDGISFGVSPASATRRGVQDMVCRLRRPAGREKITIGRMSIEIDGDRLVWKFRDA